MNTQSRESDIKAIHEAVEDYYGGWYSADPERMRRCLHEGLAKRAIKLDEAGREYLRHLTKEMMVEATRQGGGRDAIPADKQYWTITLLDCYEEIATVKAATEEYMEYIHLARQNGEWRIVNVLWTNKRAK
jgi:hypothetical protein